MASSTNSNDATRPFQERIGSGIHATHCPIKRPFRSWGDYQSQASLCERLGRNVAVCEMPQVGETPADLCREQDETSDRAVTIEPECLQWQVKPQALPSLIASLLRCTWGPRFNEGHYLSIPYETQMECVRAAGIEWTSLAEPGQRNRQASRYATHK